MDDMQNRMNAILQNPDMMQKIMSMAQSLNQSQPEQPQQPGAGKQETGAFSLPDIDPSMLQKLSGLAGQSSIDKNQRNLLAALRPYLSSERISKLEKAMRAARMANMASAFLGSSGISLFSGR